MYLWAAAGAVVVAVASRCSTSTVLCYVYMRLAPIIAHHITVWVWWKRERKNVETCSNIVSFCLVRECIYGGCANVNDWCLIVQQFRIVAVVYLDSEHEVFVQWENKCTLRTAIVEWATQRLLSSSHRIVWSMVRVADRTANTWWVFRLRFICSWSIGHHPVRVLSLVKRT